MLETEVERGRFIIFPLLAYMYNITPPGLFSNLFYLLCISVIFRDIFCLVQMFYIEFILHM